MFTSTLHERFFSGWPVRALSTGSVYHSLLSLSVTPTLFPTQIQNDPGNSQTGRTHSLSFSKFPDAFGGPHFFSGGGEAVIRKRNVQSIGEIPELLHDIRRMHLGLVVLHPPDQVDHPIAQLDAGEPTASREVPWESTATDI